MCCGTEAGSYLRRIDSCITQLKAQGPSRTCNEKKEEKEEETSSERSWGAALELLFLVATPPEPLVCESGPLGAVHVSLLKWPGGLVN